MLELKLQVPTGEVNEDGPVLVEKTYRQNFVSGMAFRKTVAMKKTLSEGSQDDHLDLMVDYIVDLFGKQFTRDEYYNGIDAENVINAVSDCLNKVVKKATQAVGSKPDPNGK